MKKIFAIELLILIMCPAIVSAKATTSDFSSVSSFKDKYTESLGEYDLYFIGKGELLKRDEYSISGANKSHFYDGQGFWLSDGTKTIDGTEAGIRVCETVRKDRSVTGNGTYTNPWVFDTVSRSSTVTFVSNVDGTIVTPTTIEVSFGSKYGTLATVQKEGYTFEGWYNEVSGGTKIESDTNVDVIGDHNLYAHQTVKKYTLNLEKQTGVTSASISGCDVVTEGSKYTCTYGKSVTIKA